MKAAVVSAPGRPPTYSDFGEPVAGAGACRVTMRAAALSHLARGRAAGSHYSADGGFPLVAGVDGVGRLDNGELVYCLLPTPPMGTMAEVTVVPVSHCIAVPTGLDAVMAAAMAIPAMSSWAALLERARFRAGETVLVNGATGVSGSLAVQVARHLGAARIIATGRNPDALQALTGLGADTIIHLGDDADAFEAALEQEFRTGIDVVLDYLWGESARRALIAGTRGGAEQRPIRFVQIGSASGPTLELPSAVLRSSAIELMGSGLGSVPFDRLLGSIAGAFDAAVQSGFKITTRSVPLANVAEAWADVSARERTVIVMGAA